MPLKHHDFYPGDIPCKPGCYIYRDVFGTVIYVGKAKNLRHRMSQYFQPSRQERADPKLRSLVNSIETWEYITVRNEDEALILETRLIKEFAPRYNILMRDDKRLLMLKIDLSEPFPRIKLARLKKDDSCLYFGPFPKGAQLRQTADYFVHCFKLRTCKCSNPGAEDRAHCLAGAVRDCCCPCTGAITEEAYREKISRLISILKGDVHDFIEDIHCKMKDAALKQKFEQAALLRDIAENVQSLYGKKNRTFEYAVIPQDSPGQDSVNDLQSILQLKKQPDDIECFDISNISGTLAVASLVHFTMGKPDKAKYRRFRIQTVEGPNDFAMMREAVSRHFSRILQSEEKKIPDLLVVDGGMGQLNYALDALVKLNCPPFPVIGLAEKREEIYLPGQKTPLSIPHDRHGLQLLQAIRDEAHRFAITYHRNLRLDLIRNSILDDIEGIGEQRKQAILKEFGSVRVLRHAAADEIAQRVPGIGKEIASQIYEFLKNHKSDGSIDPL